MLAKPEELLDRQIEWASLARVVERSQRLAVVYGPRRVGKSYLLQALCRATGGQRYQAITGTPTAQVDDFGRVLGQWIGAGPLRLDGWADAFERLQRVDLPLVVIDELPYLTETVPELTSILQRHVDAGEGPTMVVAGSSLATMAALVTPRAPLFGRAAAVVVPRPFEGPDLARLWDTPDAVATLWVDAAVGGLPGYRPLLPPPGHDVAAWIAGEMLAPGSPLLDAAEAALVDLDPRAVRGTPRTILSAIASGARTFTGVARIARVPTGALTRPMGELERAGLIARVPDPLRSRRDRYELADPHLRTWLTIISPHRAELQAGRGGEVWAQVADTTWRAQVLGPRWEAVARSHLASVAASELGGAESVGATVLSDREGRASLELDLVATRRSRVVAVGEAKLRRLGLGDLDRLRRARDLLGSPEARLVLASADGIDPTAASDPDVLTITPADVYGL